MSSEFYEVLTVAVLTTARQILSAKRPQFHVVFVFEKKLVGHRFGSKSYKPQVSFKKKDKPQSELFVFIHSSNFPSGERCV